MELKPEMKVFISKVKKDEEFVELKKSAVESGNDDDVAFVKLNVNGGGNVNVDEKQQCVDKDGDNGEIDEDPGSRKRKRECYLGMLRWISKVAKDPCSCDIEPLPERHNWKSYGSELEWKQVLLAREAVLLKKNVDAGSQQSVSQKKQKMHPGMYEDDQCYSERLRCSQRLLFSKDPSLKSREGSESSSSLENSGENFTDKQSDSTADSPNFWDKFRKKRIPIGPQFQANNLPELCALVDYQSDSKWLGTKIWPLDNAEKAKSLMDRGRGLIERDPIGKGRNVSCGCQFLGSPECVRFHVREKRMRVKLELGSAFYKWGFDRMGEDVAVSYWTKEDENKFRDIVESNRLSSDKYFWDELFKGFPRKGREALVSYYFNVFLLRRRCNQNRSGTSNIDSDDEDSEFGPIANRFGQLAAKSPGSIFCSPKKNSRVEFF